MSNNEDNMEIDATATLEEKCSSWVELCVNTQDPKTVQETLKAEAREFFRSALAVPSNYKDPREAALARLIQSIGRALTASFPSRICALSVLCGATEGIRAAESKLSMRTANLVIAFLMEQCGPIQNDDETGGVNYYSVEDYDEQIRDIAVENLAALLRCRFEIMSKGDVVTRASETVRFRCNAARQGIERRCAAPEEEDSHMDHGLGVSALNDVRGGLSTLPRSRRSRCFSLIQAVVEGIEDLVQNNKKSVAKIGKSEENELVDFVRFACNCLQGESDPRCLVQLLLLLNKIQVTFQPLFLEAQLATFPITEVFDAIAPYYPINFTPPPNDNYGITQKGLRDALMAVLSHFGYDELAAKKKKDTMLNLSLGIVLERLIPMGGDGDHLAETAREKQEAVDDLNPILFPADDSSFDRLDKGSVQQLSSALMVVHQQASVAVSQGGGNSDDDKYLADSCRTLISKIAFRLEGTNHKELWEAFVKDPVESISTQLLSTSTDGRIAIAFIACFAASGGAQTLQWALHVGLPPLIGILKNGLQDEGLATTAAYGVGAFFSSCNVAMDKAAKNGVVLHPHPLEQFSSGAFQNLYDLFENSADGHSVSLRTASIRALESILLVSPSNQIAGSEREKVTTFARSLADHVLEASEPGKASSGDVDFIETCSQALGTIIGKCMSTLSGDNVSTDELSVLTSEQVKNHLKGEVLVDILFKAKQETRGKDHLRYDRKVLAKACSSNLSAATFVIEALLHAIKDALQQYSVGSESLACAQALSHALEEGGVVAARAFHELAPPNVTAHDIFDKLSEIDPRKGKGKTNLDLPATGEETESAKRQVRTIILCHYSDGILPFVQPTRSPLPLIISTNLNCLQRHKSWYRCYSRPIKSGFLRRRYTT